MEKEFGFNSELVKNTEKASLEEVGFVGGDDKEFITYQNTKELPYEKEEETLPSFHESNFDDLSFEDALEEWRFFAQSRQFDTEGMTPLEYIKKLEEDNNNYRMDLTTLKKEVYSMSEQEQVNAYENFASKISKNNEIISSIKDFLMIYGKYFKN